MYLYGFGDIALISWLAIRRKGHNFLQSHMGQMVSGRLLQKEAFVLILTILQSKGMDFDDVVLEDTTTH